MGIGREKAQENAQQNVKGNVWPGKTLKVCVNVPGKTRAERTKAPIVVREK